MGPNMPLQATGFDLTGRQGETFLLERMPYSAHFGSTQTRTGTIQRRLERMLYSILFSCF